MKLQIYLLLSALTLAGSMAATLAGEYLAAFVLLAVFLTLGAALGKSVKMAEAGSREST